MPPFPDGWRRTAVAAIEAGAVQTALVDALEADDRAAFERITADRRQLAAHLREREAVEGGPSVERTPQAVGASDLITYVQCPKRFYWSRVRPLPRFSGPAARIGTEIHAWIERRARGQGQLLELEDRVDLTDEELAGDPGRVERLRESFLASRFAGVPPLYAERAFLLRLGDFSVGGRIDAIFGDPDGPWEIVDWKTGRTPAADDPTLGLQLDVYGLAAVEIWGKARRTSRSRTSTSRAATRSRSRWTTRRPCANGWTPSLDRDRRGRVRPDAGPRGAPTATSARSATRDRPGSRRTASPAQTTGRMTVVRSSPRTAGSRPPGSYPPSVTPGTSRASTPASAGTRTNDTARNHSRSPGWICTSPCVPNRRYDASSVTTGVMRYARSNSARSSSSPHSTTGFPFVHAAMPTSSGGGDSASGWSAGGGGPGR